MLAIIEIDDEFDGTCSTCPFRISSLGHEDPRDISSPVHLIFKCYNTDMIITTFVNDHKRPIHRCPLKAKISGDISSISDL